MTTDSTGDLFSSVWWMQQAELHNVTDVYVDGPGWIKVAFQGVTFNGERHPESTFGWSTNTEEGEEMSFSFSDRDDGTSIVGPASSIKAVRVTDELRRSMDW